MDPNSISLIRYPCTKQFFVNWVRGEKPQGKPPPTKENVKRKFKKHARNIPSLPKKFSIG